MSVKLALLVLGSDGGSYGLFKKSNFLINSGMECAVY